MVDFMRIDNQFLTSINVRPSGLLPRPTKVARAKKASSQASSHTSSSELAQIFALVSQEPEMRADVVNRAEERLEAGFYLSPEGAEQAAQAMLAADE